MLQSFVPVLLFVTVALSSSNVLPIISANQMDTEPGFESQNEDNIFSFNRLSKNILNNVFYKMPEIQPKDKIAQLLQDYTDSDNSLSDYDDALKKDNENYGEGFRKEQWHNYPRQLDRLDLYTNDENLNSKNSETDDSKKEKYSITRQPDDQTQEISNELTIDDKAIQYPLLLNPLLIFKINSDYLVNDSVKDRDKNSKLQSSRAIEKDDSDLVILERYPRKIQTTEKQHEDYEILKDFESAMDQKKIVKKRIFSLWSRLQSLSHKGHELQHRRHMYSLYGLSDSGGSGGTLTAETRAFMRPPGSPLRWG